MYVFRACVREHFPSCEAAPRAAASASRLRVTLDCSPDHAARGVEIDDMTDETDPDCRQLRPGSRLGQKSMHRCHNCGQTSYMMVSLLLMMLIRCLLLPMLIMMWRLQII